VTFRGNERKPIFKSDADCQRLHDAMAQARDLYQTRIFLVCLMPSQTLRRMAAQRRQFTIRMLPVGRHRWADTFDMKTGVFLTTDYADDTDGAGFFIRAIRAIRGIGC
jgi:hypothetical protein